jgi:hypothetical protein
MGKLELVTFVPLKNLLKILNPDTLLSTVISEISVIFVINSKSSEVPRQHGTETSNADPDPHHFGKPDPDPHQSEKLDSESASMSKAGSGSGFAQKSKFRSCKGSK